MAWARLRQARSCDLRSCVLRSKLSPSGLLVIGITGVVMNGSSPGIFCTAAQTYEASPPVAQRIAVVERQTKETKVQVSIGIDGTGKCRADTPIHFLNHMLDVSPSAVCAPHGPL